MNLINNLAFNVVKKVFTPLSTFKSSFQVNVITTYYVYRGKYEKALDVYESARKVFDEGGRWKKVALCDESSARMYAGLGQHEKALQLYESARAVFEREGEVAEAARCNRGIAGVYEELGRYEDSLGLFESARKTLSEHEGWRYAVDQTEITYSDNYIARLNFKLGRYEKALELFSSVRKECRNSRGWKDCVADCERFMASSYMELGYYDKALELYASVRKICEKEGTPLDSAYCDMNEAAVYDRLGQYEKALKLHASARSICEKEGTARDRAYCDLNTAGVLMHLGRDDTALRMLQSAKKVFAEINDYDALSTCDMNMGVSYALSGRHDRAFDLYTSIRDDSNKKGMDENALMCNLNMAGLHMVRGAYEEAFPLFEAVYAKSSCLMDKVRALYGMGWIYKQKGNIKTARAMYKEAIEEIESTRGAISSEELRSSFLGSVNLYYYTMVELCLEDKDFEAALEYVERLKTRNLADLLASRVLMPRNVFSGVKLAYQKLCLEIKDCRSQVSKEQNTARIAVLEKRLEKLLSKYNFMVTYFRKKDPEFDPFQRTTIDYTDISKLASDNETAIVEIFPMREKTVLFIMRNNHALEKSTILIPDYSGSDLTHHTTELLEKYARYHECENTQKKKARQIWEDYLDTVLKDLYKKLFLRIEPYLKGITKIIFIPYMEFHIMPLHAMFTEKNGQRRYVIDDYQISYAPSAKILKYCMERKRDKKEKVVVALANPGKDLMYARDEVESVRRLFNNSQVIAQATKDTIIDYGREAHIFHFTGHANFKALTLHGNKGGALKEDYTMEEIYESLDLPKAYLTTLSSCETGMTMQGEIDEYIGLNSAFLYAGTATVISSLWQVSDISTTLLMKKMYQLIKAGRGKAEALREAQLWLKNPANTQEHQDMLPDWCTGKQGKDKKTVSDKNRFAVEGNKPETFLPTDLSRPYYWAGFTCSGAA